jgi:predicted SnoaL-like aldol condensation-catalyzing enzyme
MTDPMPRPKAPAGKDAMVETISDYYRRRADEERQCADQTIDGDLRRIHLQRAASMRQLAEEARLKS